MNYLNGNSPSFILSYLTAAHVENASRRIAGKTDFYVSRLLLTGSCYRFQAWLSASLMPLLIAVSQLAVNLCIAGCASAVEQKTGGNLQ